MDDFLKRRIDQAVELLRDQLDPESPGFRESRHPLRRMLSAELFGDVEPGLISGIRARLVKEGDDEQCSDFEWLVGHAGNYAFVGDEVLIAVTLPFAVRLAAPEDQSRSIGEAHHGLLRWLGDQLTQRLEVNLVRFDERLYDGESPNRLDRRQLRDYLGQLRQGRRPSPAFWPQARLTPQRRPRWVSVHCFGVIACDARQSIEPNLLPASAAINEFQDLWHRALTQVDALAYAEGWTWQVDALGCRLLEQALAGGRTHLRGLRLAEFVAPWGGAGHAVLYRHCYDQAAAQARLMAWAGSVLRELTWPVRDEADYRDFVQALARQLEESPPDEGCIDRVSPAEFERFRAARQPPVPQEAGWRSSLSSLLGIPLMCSTRKASDHLLD